MSNREEIPLSLDSIVGGRGNSLDTVRSGSRDGLVEEPVSGSIGRPVKGNNGIVGWMYDHEAADSKVSGVTFVVSCYVIFCCRCLYHILRFRRLAHLRHFSR